MGYCLLLVISNAVCLFHIITLQSLTSACVQGCVRYCRRSLQIWFIGWKLSCWRVFGTSCCCTWSASFLRVGCFHAHISQLSWELSFTVAVLLRQNATKNASMCLYRCVCVCVKERERSRRAERRWRLRERKFCQLSSWSREKWSEPRRGSSPFEIFSESWQLKEGKPLHAEWNGNNILNFSCFFLDMLAQESSVAYFRFRPRGLWSRDPAKCCRTATAILQGASAYSVQ